MALTPFSRLVGQEQAVALLTRAAACDRIAPAYLFAGPEGVGRRLAARCFLESLLCAAGADQPCRSRLAQGNHPDVLWVEPTYLHQGKPLTLSQMVALDVSLPKSRPQIRLEQIRGVSRFLSRPPLSGSRSLVVLTQAETMAEAAANGLLKTLEEPGKATLILIAPSPEALLPTLVSRCQRIPFHRLSSAQMAQVLEQVGQEQVLQEPQISAMSQGSPGRSIQNWQHLQAVPPELLEEITQPPQGLQSALGLARQIDQSLNLQLQLWLVNYLQQVYWQEHRQATLVQQLEKARQQLLSYAQPRLVWEVALMNLCQQPSQALLPRGDLAQSR